MTESERFFSM